MDEKDATYYGEFRQGTRLREGRGLTIGVDGTLWEGQFVNGVLEGPGRRISMDKEVY